MLKSVHTNNRQNSTAHMEHKHRESAAFLTCINSQLMQSVVTFDYWISDGDAAHSHFAAALVTSYQKLIVAYILASFSNTFALESEIGFLFEWRTLVRSLPLSLSLVNVKSMLVLNTDEYETCDENGWWMHVR